MLVIREAQIKAFEEIALNNYIKELTQHCREFSPYLCAALSEERLCLALRQGILRAESYGFTQRGPTRFFIEMMFLFGNGFDNDPQYPWAEEILAVKDEMGQMDRAEALYTETMGYLAKVDGENHVHTLKALADLSVLWRHGVTFRPECFEQDVLRFLEEMHPRKVAEIGEAPLLRLIREGKVRGKEHYGFRTMRSIGLVVVMMFTIGHQFDSDPLHPWVVEILNQSDFARPDSMGENLERRALLWLDGELRNAKEND